MLRTEGAETVNDPAVGEVFLNDGRWDCVKEERQFEGSAPLLDDWKAPSWNTAGSASPDPLDSRLGGDDHVSDLDLR